MAVMGHAETTSGAVPLWARNTAPSEHEQPELPVPAMLDSRREGWAAIEDALTPPRDTHARDRTTDLMRATVPLPYLVGVISIALAIAAAVWTIRTDVQLMSQRMDFEAKMRESDKETFMQSFKALEAKIDAARNGAAALSAMQDNERLRQENEKLRGR